MNRLLLIIALVTAGSCSEKPAGSTDYPAHVGDIPFDASIDDPSFKVCDEERVPQYYNFGKGLQYRGEKLQINLYFTENFKPSGNKDDTGFLTIRFIVNCEGKTGRFRSMGMNEDYQEKSFSESITADLLSLVKGTDGWMTGYIEGKPYDYYQYLTFKLNEGTLIEVMP